MYNLEYYLKDETVQRGLYKLHSMGYPAIEHRRFGDAGIAVFAGGCRADNVKGDMVQALADLVRQLQNPDEPEEEKKMKRRAMAVDSSRELPAYD